MAFALAACSNFHTVVDGEVYRAAQPRAQELKWWKDEYGIRSVVRLRGGKPGAYWYDESALGSDAAGLVLIEHPISAHRFPKKWELMRLCEILETAERPILLHCMQGADRTGLASAIAVLMKGKSMADARAQLRFIPYGHSGLFGTEKLDQVLDMYEPWLGAMSFGAWAREVYQPPADGELDPAELESLRAKAGEYRAAMGGGSPAVR